MTSEEKLVNALKRISKVPMQVISATVLSVDEDNYTIDVEPAGQAELPDVRLKAAIDGLKDGVVEIPEEGSTVLIGLIGNSEDEAFLIRCSKVSKIIINGGSNGGLINIEELKKTNDLVKAIKETLDDWVAAPGDGGTALKTLWTTNSANKNAGDNNKMEDSKVTH